MKKYLLDTHLLLWLMTEPQRLPEEVKSILDSEEDRIIYYSVVSIWEAEIKRLAHPDKITNILPSALAKFCFESDIDELSLKVEHISALETLSRPDDAPPHKDPFDRILIAQAKAENMTFLTHDELIPYYSEPCIMFV